MDTASLPATQPLAWTAAFFIGVLGALLGYLILYRETRIAEVVKNPSQNWKALVVDVVIYLLCGGLVTTFLVVPGSAKEAFTGGLAWQALAGGFLAGTELESYKKSAERRALEARIQEPGPLGPEGTGGQK